MERRKTPDRRKVHMYISKERRTGPFDRRNADVRRRERAEELKKIQSLRQFKNSETSPSSPVAIDSPGRKKLVAVGVALLLLAIALFMF